MHLWFDLVNVYTKFVNVY